MSSGLLSTASFRRRFSKCLMEYLKKLRLKLKIGLRMFGIKKTGEQIVGGVLMGFANLADELEKGIALCEQEEIAKTKELDENTRRLHEITSTKHRAKATRDNILKIISA